MHFQSGEYFSYTPYGSQPNSCSKYAPNNSVMVPLTVKNRIPAQPSFFKYALQCFFSMFSICFSPFRRILIEKSGALFQICTTKQRIRTISMVGFFHF